MQHVSKTDSFRKIYVFVFKPRITSKLISNDYKEKFGVSKQLQRKLRKVFNSAKKSVSKFCQRQTKK